MYPTVEVRWFYQGAVPPQAMTWFRHIGPEPEKQPGRVDYYLQPTGQNDPGIKLREGKIEIKQRQQQYHAISFHEQVTGVVEEWCKWSFELAEDDVHELAQPTRSWIGVKKERMLHTYQVTGDRQVIAASPEDFPDQGCDLEIANVAARGQLWWTLCFEAFGNGPDLKEILLSVAREIFSTNRPPPLRAADSYSYPTWLKAIAQVHDSA